MAKTILGHIRSMGWTARLKTTQKFRMVIELDEPPTWPISIAWQRQPVTVTLINYDSLASTDGGKST